jgi:hypothetical protein
VIVYFLPGNGIFGGIKVAHQLVESLLDLGYRGAIAIPGGRAEGWFSSRAWVIDYEETLSRWEESDIAIFSHPSDFDSIARCCKRRIFHCQGTDPKILPIVKDPGTRIFTSWEQANLYMKSLGREAFDVGISVSDEFFYSGEAKYPYSVAYMPRRGKLLVAQILGGLDRLHHFPIDQLNEQQVASTMRDSSIFLALSRNEWFGLPALEAMAAGCLVLSVPALGGSEYLKSEINCIVGEPPTLRSFLAEYSWKSLKVQSLRSKALTTAHHYRRDKATERLSSAIQGGAFTW